MSRNWFVPPKTVRLPLSEGDWIEVRAELNIGQTMAMYADLSSRGEDGKVRINDHRAPFARLVAYITDWSACDEDGKAEPFSGEALEHLPWDLYGEIVEAVDAHIAAIEAKREARKNGQGGAIGSSAISSSLVA